MPKVTPMQSRCTVRAGLKKFPKSSQGLEFLKENKKWESRVAEFLKNDISKNSTDHNTNANQNACINMTNIVIIIVFVTVTC